jgi:hypothetical protein
MKRAALKVIFSLIIFSGFLLPLGAYPVTYKEQFYRLYRLHYIQYPDDAVENIYWLEKAINADFANPLYAFARIADETEWEKYRALFMMHINLKLIEQYLYLGGKWNKRNVYFFNAPWKKQNLESLETTEKCFRAALYYWKDAREWAEKSLDRRFRWINLRNVQFWEDEAARIDDGSLDYETIINRELALLQSTREKFQTVP